MSLNSKIYVLRFTFYSSRITLHVSLFTSHPRLGFEFSMSRVDDQASRITFTPSLFAQNGNPQFLQLFLVHRGRTFGHQIDGAGSLGEGDDIADGTLTRQEHYNAV